MTDGRAFWEAVATVCVPSVVIWSVLFYLAKLDVHAGEWVLWLIFFLLPLPLIFPIYNRYRKGDRRGTKPRTRRYHFLMAFLTTVVSLFYAIASLHQHRDKWDLFFRMALSAGWLLIGGGHIRRALKADKNLPATGSSVG
jgi:drug/metabolite transporter (DMT)-like permease